MSRIVKIILFVVCLAGLFLRFSILRTRDIHYDEAIFNVIAYKSTFWQIISIDHPVKDHGILYFLVLKLTHFFTQDIMIIRTINLLFYAFAYWAVVLLLSQKGKYVPGLLAGIMFSFSSFFVYLYTFLTPYNFVLTLFLCSFYFLERFQNEKDRKKRSLFQILFVGVTATAWYANYSFIYTAFFYLFYLFYSFFFKKKVIRTLFVLYGQVVLLMTPGVFQVLSNLSYIRDSAQWLDNRYSSFSTFIYEVGTHLLYQHSSVLSTIIFFYFVFKAFIFLQSEESKAKFILLTLLTSFCALFVSIYVINEYYVGIKLERTFWLPYISVIMLLSISLNAITTQSQKYSIVLVGAVVLMYIFGSYKTPQFNISGRVTDETRYLDFISSELLGVKNKTIYIYDPNSAHNYPLWMYYFSGIYPKTSPRGVNIGDLLKQNVVVYFTQRIKEFTPDELIKASKKDNVIIIAFVDDEVIKAVKNKHSLLYLLTFSTDGKGALKEYK